MSLLDSGASPKEIYDALIAEIDPGMHHERELTDFYLRLERSSDHYRT